ncbi:MAG: cadherin repeat domain-containing protein [Clostridiales bacterium]|nr:cadherin repeat domain-containing protein [Clostridiales bacterium]
MRKEIMINNYKTAAIRIMAVFAFCLALIVLLPMSVQAKDNGIPEGYEPPYRNNYEPYQIKDFFTDETITVDDFQVSPDRYGSFDDTITLRFFNTTIQETEPGHLVEAKYDFDRGGFYLPEMKFRKGHNYIIFVEDHNYTLGTKKYVQALGADDPNAEDGEGLYDFKKNATYSTSEGLKYVYDKLDSINVYKAGSYIDDPFDENRYTMMDLDRVPGLTVECDGDLVPGVRFRFVSDMETVEATSDAEGRVHARLIEDIQYMVYVDDDDYWLDPFPLTVKDKSEYGEGRYCYSHADCHRVECFEVIHKVNRTSSPDDSDHTMISLNEKARVTGLRVSDMILLERKLDADEAPVTGLKDYDAIGLYAINTHRWEISKITDDPDLHAKVKLDTGKKVTHVYYLKGTGLVSIPFSQNASGSVEIDIDSLGLYPIIISYDKKAQPMTVKANPVKLKAKTLKKRTQTIKVAKALTIKNAKGSKIFRIVKAGKAKKYFRINRKTGKIKVRKGLKKGTYKVTVKITAAGNDEYLAGSKTATIKVRVR